MIAEFFSPARVASAAASLLALLLASPLGATAAPAKLVIVHTNDIHDHVRASEDGVGGLPYVAGFVSQLRREHGDVLVLDAGDVTEKGDLIGARTHGVITYEAMRLAGYHAVTIGNHDLDRVPLERLRQFETALGQRLLCANLLSPDGEPLFEPSRIVQVGEVRVGLVGLTLAASENRTREGLLDLADSGRVLARKARALRSAGADIVVAVCHEGTKACARLSRLAPEVAVFVAAHTHELVTTPIVVPGTGALIVQAGSYARWAGLLELELDRARGRIVRHRGSVVNMTGFTPDRAILDLVAKAERDLAPDGDVFVMNNERPVTAREIGRLGAEALRRQTGADIGFCLPSQVVRDVLPAGRLDYNSLYRAVGLIGVNIVEVELTGAEIIAHLAALQRQPKETPEWSGFVARRTKRGAALQADLEPTRTYRVVMPRREWLMLQRHVTAAAEGPVMRASADMKERGRRANMTLADALRDYLIEQRTEGKTLHGLLADLEAAQTASIDVALLRHDVTGDRE